MAWEFVTIARLNPRVWVWPSTLVDREQLAREIDGATFDIGSAQDTAELLEAFPALAPANGRPRPTCLIASRADWHAALMSASIMDALINDGWEIVMSSLVGNHKETRLGRRAAEGR